MKKFTDLLAFLWNNDNSLLQNRDITSVKNFGYKKLLYIVLLENKRDRKNGGYWFN